MSPHARWTHVLSTGLLAASASLAFLDGSAAAADDGLFLGVTRDGTTGQVQLAWVGTAPWFDVYRGTECSGVVGASNLLGTTTAKSWTDQPPAAPIVYYLVQPPPPATCGNAVREAGEECDDGNTALLDGCSSTCKFEQVQRARWFKVQFTANASCPRNAFGAAFQGSAQTALQAAVDDGVSTGWFSILFAAVGAHDLTGTDDPSFQLGVLTGLPLTSGAVVGYNGTNDLDWWYRIDAGTIDAQRRPRYPLTASITAHTLEAGPGTIVLPMSYIGLSFRFTSARVSITTGAPTSPLTSTGASPGHLSSEHLDPALSSYATCGQPNAAGSGFLCGNLTAQSLARTPIPPALRSLCPSYLSTNSMLDLLVGGCSSGSVPLVLVTQPDAADTDAPPAGAGPPYTLTANTSRVVTGCKDANGTVVSLTSCLAAAAYSGHYRLATDRVIPRP